MGYRTDVRMITTMEGYKCVQDCVAEQNDVEILLQPDIEKQYNDIVYLGWSDIKGMEVDTLKDICDELIDRDITFRSMYLGETLDDIEENAHTNQNDEDKYIPYPSIVRNFDDKETEKELRGYTNSLNCEKEEEMECD